jgi:hypothetical protein
MQTMARHPKLYYHVQLILAWTYNLEVLEDLYHAFSSAYYFKRMGGE